MNYIQYMKPGSKFWALPNGLEDVSWSEFWSNWKKAIAKAKEQIVDNWENLKQDYKDAADPIAASERKQTESIEATRAKQASMKFISDNRTDYEKKRDRKNFELKEFEQKEQLNKDATDAVMLTLTGPVYAVQHLASPDGLVKTVGNTRAAVQNGGGPYLEKAVASAAGDILDATILTAPLFTPEAKLARAMNENIKQGIQLGLYYHGSPNRNISRFKIGKDGGIYFTQNRDAAKLYTGTFGTGKVYNADLDLGNKTITIDNGGAAWTKIPENKVAEAFNLTPQQVHDIIGSYNLGEVPWHYGFTKMFGYKPKNNYYAIDQVVKLGKDLGISSLIINNAKDNGKRLFSRTMPYDLTVVYNPRQIILGGPTVADEAVLRGQLGWAPKQTIHYRHGSLDPELKTFVPKHDRWDVVTHGADPNMYFVTDLSTPVSSANMMDLRPYQYTGSIVAEKPMVQIGDFNIAGKNSTRNQLIARARQQGADTYLLQDIVDNKVPHLNIVARFIGPEGEAVQGGAASIKWYGPTMGKTTAVKTNPNLVDIDPLLKPIRAKHAERLGLKISDPKVSADPAYKQEVADFILEWRANPENQGKTLVASTKHLLDPQYKVEFANEPSIPDFETFAARNKARGFKETDEQLRAWYNSILELGRELNVDNRYVSDIESGTRAAKISEAERLGIPKGDRGSLSASQQEAVRDLHHYITDGKFKLKFLFDAETNLFFWGNAKPTPSTNAITTIAQHPQATIRLGDDGIGYMRIPTLYGTLTYFPHLKTTSHTISFPKSKINPQGFGEAAARAENLFGKSVILTSPKTDATDAGVVVEGLSSTVPKRQVYDFYKQLALTSKPGTYVTGDAAAYPLGHQAIVDYVGGNSTKAVATILSGETPTVTAASRTGLSPDSYISLLRSAQRPEWKLSFNRKAGFGKWNNSAVNNSDIYNAWQAARNGTLELKLAYIQLFNDWVAPYGGAKAYINDKGIIIHPHPFIVRQKSGGTIHIKKKNRGKFTASAKAAGEGVQEHAHKVMNDPNATPLQKKRANFAIQAKKWHRKHQLGGKINYLNIF